MEQSGLKDERVAHIAGSERPGERPHYSGSSRSERASSKPRTRWLRMSGQSSVSCDRKEDSPSQETKQPNEFSAAPSRSPDLPRNERRRVRPLPRFFFLQNLRFFPFTRCSVVLARSLSLLVGGPLAGIPVGGAGRRLVGVVGALRPPVLPAHLPPPARNRRWRRGWGGGCRQMFSPPASPARRCEFLRCRRSVGLWSEAGRVVLIRGSGKRSGPVRTCAVIE